VEHLFENIEVFTERRSAGAIGDTATDRKCLLRHKGKKFN
jgi:hypothetical protein